MAHLAGLLLLLYSRLRDVFSDTVYKISKCTTYCFYSVFTLLVASGLFLLTGNYSFTLALLALLLFIVLTTCQVLAWTFVYKLYSIRKLDGESAQMFDTKFLSFLRKYAILSLICVMFTTSYSIVATISAIIGYGFFWAEMLSIILVSDVFIDSLSMFLSFQENQRYYVCLCWICHDHCPCLVCMKSRNHEINVKIELHQIVSKTISTSPRSASSN